jgi:hypothetical protein
MNKQTLPESSEAAKSDTFGLVASRYSAAQARGIRRLTAFGGPPT